MLLGIDAREIENGVFTGIGGPLANFLNYFSQEENDDACVLFSTKAVPIHFGSKVRNVVIEDCLTFYWDQVKLSKALKEEGIELFYSPYYKIPYFSPCPTVSAVLDLMYLALDEYRQDLGLLKQIYYFTFGRMLAQKADYVWTCSQHSKQDIVKLYGVKPEKITVIPLSIDNHYRLKEGEDAFQKVKTKFGIDARYIYYFGSFKFHKNVKSIIRAFKRVTAEYRDLKLVLAGPKEYCYPQLQTLVNELSLKDKVMFLGKIADKEDARLLYTAAEIFVMPTLYEGFGLPPAEAMACGTPVVTSNSTALPEVAGDAGILVNPYQVDDITQAIRHILQDEKLRERLKRAGPKQAENFYEEKIAKQTYDYFKKIADEENQSKSNE